MKVIREYETVRLVEINGKRCLQLRNAQMFGEWVTVGPAPDKPTQPAGFSRVGKA